ncbi:DUF3015 family protein [Vibrio sp. SCSIO 43137]|uniref:DUF3015 family protein n=1 Tax=Vibrio sp. SCSIO 43137 TaxID=3021011 RepID=UPI00230778FC|nr:DUF3015 family protein [Vibrio sp. SCSIO 43137]WCE31424.1 DUF3015 family protein [Vibrio sp. SCSIO 43137]
MFKLKYSLLALALFSKVSLADNLWMDCGIGHWIAGPTLNGFPALSTNVSFDLGTTATMSNLSTPESCAGPFWAAAKFIQQSYPQIEENTAQGDGEHMLAMLSYFDCSDSANRAIKADLRGEFSALIRREEYLTMDGWQKSGAYFDMLSATLDNHKHSCQRVQ